MSKNNKIMEKKKKSDFYFLFFSDKQMVKEYAAVLVYFEWRLLPTKQSWGNWNLLAESSEALAEGRISGSQQQENSPWSITYLKSTSIQIWPGTTHIPSHLQKIALRVKEKYKGIHLHFFFLRQWTLHSPPVISCQWKYAVEFFRYIYIYKKNIYKKNKNLWNMPFYYLLSVRL